MKSTTSPSTGRVRHLASSANRVVGCSRRKQRTARSGSPDEYRLGYVACKRLPVGFALRTHPGVPDVGSSYRRLMRDLFEGISHRFGRKISSPSPLLTPSMFRFCSLHNTKTEHRSTWVNEEVPVESSSRSRKGHHDEGSDLPSGLHRGPGTRGQGKPPDAKGAGRGPLRKAQGWEVAQVYRGKKWAGILGGPASAVLRSWFDYAALRSPRTGRGDGLFRGGVPEG